MGQAVNLATYIAQFEVEVARRSPQARSHALPILGQQGSIYTIGFGAIELECAEMAEALRIDDADRQPRFSDGYRQIKVVDTRSLHHNAPGRSEEHTSELQSRP